MTFLSDTEQGGTWGKRLWTMRVDENLINYFTENQNKDSWNGETRTKKILNFTWLCQLSTSESYEAWKDLLDINNFNLYSTYALF